MDPNATLAQIRECIDEADGPRAIELFEALDGWLSSGGFLPTDWQH